MASLIAIFSLTTSTTNIAPGSLVIFAIDPRFFSNFSLSLPICSFSFFERVLNVPSCFILSMELIFFTAFLIVIKLVSIPPGHLSVIYGILTFFAVSATMSLACFFVATNKIFLPDDAIFANADEASSSLLIVLYKFIM